MKTKQLLSIVLIAAIGLGSAFAAGIDTSAVEGAGFADLPESQKAAIIANVALSVFVTTYARVVGAIIHSFM